MQVLGALSFDGLTESLKRFIEQLQRLNFIQKSSAFLTDLLEAAFIDTGVNAALTPGFGGQDLSVGQRAAAQRAGGGNTNVEVVIRGDTEVIAGVVATVNDGDLRAAQTESPDNE